MNARPISVSRSVLYASDGLNFAVAARAEAMRLWREIDHAFPLDILFLSLNRPSHASLMKFPASNSTGGAVCSNDTPIGSRPAASASS